MIHFITLYHPEAITEEYRIRYVPAASLENGSASLLPLFFLCGY